MPVLIKFNENTCGIFSKDYTYHYRKVKQNCIHNLNLND